MARKKRHKGPTPKRVEFTSDLTKVREEAQAQSVQLRKPAGGASGMNGGGKAHPPFNAGYCFYRRKGSGSVLPRMSLLQITGASKLDSSLNQISLIDYYKIPDAESFALTTVYPGLFIGSGYPSPVDEEKKDEEFKLGFFFDHTTGLPVVPGSSVKGVLRRLFRKNLTEGELEESRKARCEYLSGLLGLDKNNQITPQNLGAWERRFFTPDAKGRGIIYHDAYISKLPENKAIWADDFITPHIDEKGKPAPFKNPKPLRFLKIAPGAEITFQFDLRQANLGVFLIEGAPLPAIAWDKIKNLFRQILIDFGLGARRNLGYGSFKR